MTDTRDAVDRALNAALADTGEMVNRWVACVETVDSDGVRALWLLCNSGAKAWDNIGMLGYALQCEQARATAEYINGDDG